MVKQAFLRKWGAKLLAFVLLVCLCASMAQAEQAEIITSGNTFMDYITGTLNATENWVILKTDQVPQAMIDDFVAGTDSPAFNTGSPLTFMYQLANNGGGTDDIDTLSQTADDFSSWGFFSGWGFTDAGNPVGIDENMGIDTWPAGGGDMRYGGTADFVKNEAAYVDPTSNSIGSSSIDWFFDPSLEAENDVSSILVFTTTILDVPDDFDDLKWKPVAVSVHATDCYWCGGASPFVPEPAGVALLVSGCAALGLVSFMRRQRR